MNKEETPDDGAEPALTATRSTQPLDALRAQLLHRMDDAAQASQRAGMTPEILQALLDEKSGRETTDWLDAVADREGWK